MHKGLYYLYTQLDLTCADTYREIDFRYRESGCDTLARFEETPWFFNVPGYSTDTHTEI
jgi:hypothetical protein